MEAIVLNSGGLDILYAIEKTLEADPDAKLHSVTILYGQLNAKRVLPAAKALADTYCVSHEVIEMPGDWTYPSERIEGFRENTHQNAFLNIIGAVLARSRGIRYILSGVDDIAAKADFADKLVDLLKTSKLTQWVPVPLIPGKDLPKVDKFEYLKGNPLLEVAVSCIWPEPCGECPKCKNRIAAGLTPN